MSENPARNELASSVSVSGSCCSKRSCRVRCAVVEVGDRARCTSTAAPMSADQRSDDHREQEEQQDRERRRVEEQLAGAQRHVGLLEQVFGLARAARRARRSAT